MSRVGQCSRSGPFGFGGGDSSFWLSAGLSLAKVAAYLGDTKEVVLATYAHFMTDDDDRARQIMDEFFKAPDSGPCALDVPSQARK